MNVFTPPETVLVLMLCCGGYTVKEIAQLLNRSRVGVRKAFQEIYQKSGMSSQNELIAWFYRNARS